MSRARGRRGLLVVALVLFFLVVVVDLVRPGSYLRSEWRAVTTPEGTQAERTFRRFLRR